MNEMDLLKRKEMTRCNVKLLDRKIANVKNKTISMVVGLRHVTFESYESTRHNFDQSLLVVGNRLREMIDREAKR